MPTCHISSRKSAAAGAATAAFQDISPLSVMAICCAKAFFNRGSSAQQLFDTKRHLSIGGMLCERLCRKHEAFDLKITAMACVTRHTCLAKQMSRCLNAM